MSKRQVRLPFGMSELDHVQRWLGLTPNVESKSSLSEPVFICIDCEAFEHAHQKITEIGVAVLDCREVADLDPGIDAEAWFAKIRYAHFRPAQYAHLSNKTFVKGCAKSFNFGSSTWIDLKDARGILQNVFRYPTQLDQACRFDNSLSGEARNIVFVAHGASNDSAFLKQLGFSLTADVDVKRTIDTQNLAGGHKKRPVGLHRLLLSLGIEPVNLHNAGNDAAYTLQALLSMAVRDHAKVGSVSASLKEYAGKLPPPKHNPLVAPQIWVGTAAQVFSGTENAGESRTTTSTLGKSERRDRKRAMRAKQSNDGMASADHEQRSLPS